MGSRGGVGIIGAVLVASAIGCGSPPDTGQPVDDGAAHDAQPMANCTRPIPERPYSDQDQRIFEVISYSTDDPKGALREMAEKFEISESAAQDAYVRVLQGKQSGWPKPRVDALLSIVTCAAEAHGLSVMELGPDVEDHLTVFVDAPELVPDALDRLGEDLLLLEPIETVTAQLHVDGVAKIRRDYPLPGRRGR